MTSFRSAARPEPAITASSRSAGNQLIEARPVDRTARFVFFLGEALKTWLASGTLCSPP